MGQSQSQDEDQNQGDNNPNALEQLKQWYGLARCLRAGTSSRPALPLELVLAILRLAGCTSHVPRIITSIEDSCEADSYGSEVTRESWFTTQPWTRTMLTNAARMQLVTISRDQGFCDNPSQGNWSWFEIEIMQMDKETPTPKTHPETGQPLRWTSHHNVLGNREDSKREGEVFGCEHDIWRHLAEGDSIQVNVCAQFGGWMNIAKEGELRIWNYLEPVLHAPGQ